MGLDPTALPQSEQKVLEGLRRVLADARLTAQDYELAESRDEQLGQAREAKDFLRQAEQGILAASHTGVFGAVEVAHLSASIERIIEYLR